MNTTLDPILDKLKNQNILPLYEELIETIEIYNTESDKKIKIKLRELIAEKKQNLFEKINIATGSLRAPMSLKGRFSFPEMLKGADDLLLKYGGHDMAAGFGLKEHNLEKLSEYFTKYIEKQNLVYDEAEVGIIELELSQITKELLDYIFMLDPFGIDFPFPQLKIILSEGYSINFMSHKTDQKLCHLRIENITGFDILFFNLDIDFYNKNVERGVFKNNIELILTIGQNSFRGLTTYQLLVDEYNLV